MEELLEEVLSNYFSHIEQKKTWNILTLKILIYLN
jgi:hypothetical protein